MSWESTVTYYQVINEAVRERMGGFHSARVLLYSIDFAELEACQSSGRWDDSATLLLDAAKRLEHGSADFLLICANTMHKVAPQIQAGCTLPLLDIADATADVIKERGIRTVGLLGTKYTLRQDFYTGKLAKRGLDVLIPSDEDVELLNHIIYDELCMGVIREDSRRELARMMEQLRERGAQGMILGCTEIGLLVHDDDSPLPLFDTTLIHARAAATLAMED